MGGEIASPVFAPGGQFSGRAPQSCATERPDPLATHTLSLPSMAMPQGPMMLFPPSNGGSPGPSGRTMETSPPGNCCRVSNKPIHIFAMFAAFDPDPVRLSTFDLSLSSTSASFSRVSGWPTVLLTQALPRLSMAMARGANPTLNCSALPGSLAGNRVTVLEPLLVTQIRSC